LTRSVLADGISRHDIADENRELPSLMGAKNTGAAVAAATILRVPMFERARLMAVLTVVLASHGGLGCQVGQEGLGGATPVTSAREDGGARPTTDARTGGQPGADAADAAGGGVDATATAGTPVDATAADAVPADAPLPADAPGAPATDAAAATADAPAPASRCLAARPLPVSFRRVIDGRPSDDLAFDRDGHLVAFDRQGLVRLLRDGGVDVLANDVIGNRGGTLAALPGGDLIVGDFQRSRAVRLTSSGQLSPIAGDVPSPMKMARGPGRAVYVTGKNGVITRIGESDGSVSTAATTPFDLGGLTFGSDYRVLYVGSLASDAIHAFDVAPDGRLSGLRVWRSGIARAQALVTDECGDLYAISEGDARIRRIGAGGAQVVASLPQASLWSLAFGSGRQGWSHLALYAQEAATGRVHELDVGVAGQPPPPATE
jgi:hypothetical protein